MSERMMRVSGEDLTDTLKDLLRNLDDLRAERDRYKAALHEIANEDYRGNRPWSAVRAYQALKAERAA